MGLKPSVTVGMHKEETMAGTRLRGVLVWLFVSALLAVTLLSLVALSGPHPARAERAVALGGHAVAATRFVSANGSGSECSQGRPCALQTALDRVADGDTLYVGAGTYTHTAGTVISLTQSITLLGGWDGSPSGPPHADPAAFPTILDGRRQGTVVVLSFGKFVLDGFTITGGWGDSGGGMRVDRAQAEIRNNIITANGTYTSSTWEGGRGGAIALFWGTPITITHNHFISNTSGYGGALYVDTHQAWISDNVFTGNHALRRGGAICFESGSGGEVLRSLFQDNVAGDDGGAMLIWDSAPRVEANRLIHNTARVGAALSLGNNAAPLLVNNWLAHNEGVAISSSQSAPRIVNNTLIGITREVGIRVTAGGTCALPNCGAVTITNNIIMRCRYGVEVSGMLTGTLDYNDVWANDRGDYSGQAVDWRGPHNLSADPLLVNEQSADLHLRHGSPCVDAAAARLAPDTDIDGEHRPQGRAPDIGADEGEAWLIFLPLLHAPGR